MLRNAVILLCTVDLLVFACVYAEDGEELTARVRLL